MPSILLVEDEAIISEPFGIVLRSQGYNVDIAANGLEALDFCANKTYDLILLDIMMPYCNGIEFLKKAKLKAVAPTTKVILMTNLSGGKEIDEAMSLGASKKLLKAKITPGLLIEMVKEELGL